MVVRGGFYGGEVSVTRVIVLTVLAGVALGYAVWFCRWLRRRTMREHWRAFVASLGSDPYGRFVTLFATFALAAPVLGSRWPHVSSEFFVVAAGVIPVLMVGAVAALAIIPTRPLQRQTFVRVALVVTFLQDGWKRVSRRRDDRPRSRRTAEHDHRDGLPESPRRHDPSRPYRRRDPYPPDVVRRLLDTERIPA